MFLFVNSTYQLNLQIVLNAQKPNKSSHPKKILAKFAKNYTIIKKPIQTLVKKAIMPSKSA